MPKDSQPDNKRARMEKCNWQTPITREVGKNHKDTSEEERFGWRDDTRRNQ